MEPRSRQCGKPGRTRFARDGAEAGTHLVPGCRAPVLAPVLPTTAGPHSQAERGCLSPAPSVSKGVDRSTRSLGGSLMGPSVVVKDRGMDVGRRWP